MSKILCYVRSVLSREVIIICNDKLKQSFLKSIGAKRKFFITSRWIVGYSSDVELSNLFDQLRGLGFFFSYDEHGWGPSDLFRYYRDNGFLAGKFKEIFWVGDGNYRVTEE